MKTNWEILSKKLAVLRDDGSELFIGQSMQALEEILGDEWIEDTIDCFIEGRKGNELAIKTVRRIASNKAAEYAYTIFLENKKTNIQKAQLALWAMSDIRMPVCMQYVEECIGDENYEGIAIAILRNLIYDSLHPYEADKLLKIFDKISEEFKEDIEPLQNYVRQNLLPTKWYTLLDSMQKRPAMYAMQKVEDIYLFNMGYAISLSHRGIVDEDLNDFSENFTKFVIADYNAPSHCNWSTAIRLFSSSDAGSVELFFEELAKYKTGESDFDRIKYREENKIFCCEQMAEEVKKKEENNGVIKYDNTDVLINKWGNGKYGIPLHNESESVIEIKHCPWCGTKLKY
jgi:hypothetical protein